MFKNFKLSKDDIKKLSVLGQYNSNSKVDNNDNNSTSNKYFLTNAYSCKYCKSTKTSLHPVNIWPDEAPINTIICNGCNKCYRIY